MIACDSDDIDDALLTRLNSDTTLRSLAPDGAWLYAAPQNARRFILVSHVLWEDEAVFGKRGLERVVYPVQTKFMVSGTAEAEAAAYRIDQLLEDVPLVAPGYTGAACYREERIADTEIDEADASLRWQIRGGHYRVEMSVNP